MSQPPSDISGRKNSLSLIADLMALAIIRKMAKEKRVAEPFQLDFAAKGSVCADKVNAEGESVQ